VVQLFLGGVTPKDLTCFTFVYVGDCDGDTDVRRSLVALLLVCIESSYGRFVALYIASSVSTSLFACNEMPGNRFLGVEALLVIALTTASSQLLFLGRW
jgi:hypothetical protein